MYCLSDSARNQTLTNLINFLPWLEFLPTLLPTSRMLKRNIERRARYAKKQLEERHQMTFDANNPRDFIEAYLARMRLLRSQGQETTFDGKDSCSQLLL